MSDNLSIPMSSFLPSVLKETPPKTKTKPKPQSPSKPVLLASTEKTGKQTERSEKTKPQEMKLEKARPKHKIKFEEKMKLLKLKRKRRLTESPPAKRQKMNDTKPASVESQKPKRLTSETSPAMADGKEKPNSTVEAAKKAGGASAAEKQDSDSDEEPLPSSHYSQRYRRFMAQTAPIPMNPLVGRAAVSAGVAPIQSGKAKEPTIAPDDQIFISRSALELMMKRIQTARRISQECIDAANNFEAARKEGISKEKEDEMRAELVVEARSLSLGIRAVHNASMKLVIDDGNSTAATNRVAKAENTVLTETSPSAEKPTAVKKPSAVGEKIVVAEKPAARKKAVKKPAGDAKKPAGATDEPALRKKIIFK